MDSSVSAIEPAQAMDGAMRATQKSKRSKAKDFIRLPNVRRNRPAKAEGWRRERTGKRSLPGVPWSGGLALMAFDADNFR